MKIFETPVLNIKEFNRVNILTASGDMPEGKTAFDKAKAALTNANVAETSILEFVANS